LNDSKIELGGNRDRHANIGEGTIGAEGLAPLVGHPQIRDLPLLLEVPGTGEGPRAEDVVAARAVVTAGIELYDGPTSNAPAKSIVTKKATPAKKPAKKIAAKKTVKKSTPVKKPAKKIAAKKTVKKSTPAKKPVKKSTPVKKPAKKIAAKKTVKKSTPVKKPAKKIAAKKTVKKATPAKKTAKKK
jgi:hypothetical protein